MADVTLQPHDPTWDADFERERDRIRAVAGADLLGAFHIGSTAVPGLVAKPNIDIAAVYDSSGAVRDAKETLLGEYTLHRDGEQRVVLTRTDETPGVVIHLQSGDARPWREQLAFRELLRADADARKTYENAKIAAAEAHPDDVDAYTDAKEPVVRALIDRAYEAGYDGRVPTVADEGH